MTKSHNGQQPGSTENTFFDHSKFEAIKSLSGWEAAHSDEDQFVPKWRWVAEPFSRYRRLTSGLSNKRIQKMALLLPHTFVFSYLPHGFWHLYESCWSQKHSKKKPGCLKRIWSEVIRLLRKYCKFCASALSLHRESTDSLILRQCSSLVSRN